MALTYFLSNAFLSTRMPSFAWHDEINFWRSIWQRETFSPTCQEIAFKKIQRLVDDDCIFLSRNHSTDAFRNLPFCFIVLRKEFNHFHKFWANFRITMEGVKK